MSYISWKSCLIDKLFEKENNDEVRRCLLGLHCCKFIFKQNRKIQILTGKNLIIILQATQAATYRIPSYHYWCSHAFHVLPSHQYYSYRIHFNRSWCTAAYYRDILAEFPIQHYPKGCESGRLKINIHHFNI